MTLLQDCYITDFLTAKKLMQKTKNRFVQYKKKQWNAITIHCNRLCFTIIFTILCFPLNISAFHFFFFFFCTLYLHQTYLEMLLLPFQLGSGIVLGSGCSIQHRKVLSIIAMIDSAQYNRKARDNEDRRFVWYADCRSIPHIPIKHKAHTTRPKNICVML